MGLRRRRRPSAEGGAAQSRTRRGRHRGREGPGMERTRSPAVRGGDAEGHSAMSTTRPGSSSGLRPGRSHLVLAGRLGGGSTFPANRSPGRPCDRGAVPRPPGWVDVGNHLDAVITGPVEVQRPRGRRRPERSQPRPPGRPLLLMSHDEELGRRMCPFDAKTRLDPRQPDRRRLGVGPRHEHRAGRGRRGRRSWRGGGRRSRRGRRWCRRRRRLGWWRCSRCATRGARRR